MIVRGIEFPDEMLKLFIERIIGEIGSISDTFYKINSFTYDGNDFDLFGKERMKKLEANVEYWKKRVDMVSSDLKHYTRKYSEERESGKDNRKKVQNLEYENDRYANTVIEYERTLSRLRLEEFKR